MIVLTAIMADEERNTLFPLSIISGFPSSFFAFLPESILSLYFIAFLLHFPMQSIQTTQREESITCFLLSMHEHLQLRAHNPQPLHCVVSIVGRKRENLEMSPKKVPTGHIVLQ